MKIVRAEVTEGFGIIPDLPYLFFPEFLIKKCNDLCSYFKSTYIGFRICGLVQKSFSKIYKRCGQISRFFIGGKTKTSKFLIIVGKFQIFLIFTTATHTGK